MWGETPYAMEITLGKWTNGMEWKRFFVVGFFFLVVKILYMIVD